MCTSLHVETLLQPLAASLCLTSPQAACDERRRVCPARFGSAFTPCARSPVSSYKQPHLQQPAYCKVWQNTQNKWQVEFPLSPQTEDMINNTKSGVLIDPWLLGVAEADVTRSTSAKPAWSNASYYWWGWLWRESVVTPSHLSSVRLCHHGSSSRYCPSSAGSSDRSNPPRPILCPHSGMSALSSSSSSPSRSPAAAIGPRSNVLMHTISQEAPKAQNNIPLYSGKSPECRSSQVLSHVQAGDSFSARFYP